MTYPLVGTKVEGWRIENMSHTAKGGRPAQIDRQTLAQSIRAGNPDAVIAYNVGGQQYCQTQFANQADNNTMYKVIPLALARVFSFLVSSALKQISTLPPR